MIRLGNHPVASDLPACSPVRHGAAELGPITVDTYNAELRDAEGFLGDRASKRAFQAILEQWRERLRDTGEDPLGAMEQDEAAKQSPSALIDGGNVAGAGVLQSAIEEFAQELATIVGRFLQQAEWRDTQRIAVGAGMRASPAGELAIARAGVLLTQTGQQVELRPIGHDPDEAGLIGAIHLPLPSVLAEHDAILAVDIGGTNIRAGIVALNRREAMDLSAAGVADFELWRHRDDTPGRDDVVAWLAETLDRLAQRAGERRMSLAPFVGIGCPGLIRADGSIEKGGQNLPGGDWERDDFNLPDRLCELLRKHRRELIITMHNDAVVQGLSEVAAMQEVERWGVLTIGTGLGNARFSNTSASRARHYYFDAS